MGRLSDSHEKARKMLPKKLWPVLVELMEHYKFAAEKMHGHKFVSPVVLAELILMGWRASADPVRSPKN